MKVFNIKPYDNFDVIFRLIICKTRKEMYKARQKYDIGEVEKKDYTGLFVPMAYQTNDNIKLPGNFRSNVFGTMYLNLDDLRKQGDITIVHECGHAAFAYEQLLRRYTGNYSDDNNCEFQANGEGDEQEVFCYFLENAFNKVRKAVNEYKKGVK